MPTYEFRCRACGETFTEARPMAESMAPATCPSGHDDTVRLLDVAGVARRGAGPAPAPAASGGGGCCGSGCCGG
jgi:putative FmdB family regulatory protein